MKDNFDEINIDGRTIPLRDASMVELNNILGIIGKRENAIKKEIDDILQNLT